MAWRKAWLAVLAIGLLLLAVASPASAVFTVDRAHVETPTGYVDVDGANDSAWFMAYVNNAVEVNVTFTTDAGSTWSTPERVDDGEGVRGGNAARRILDIEAASPDVALVGYPERDTSTNQDEARAVFTTDGGSTWTNVLVNKSSETMVSVSVAITDSGDWFLAYGDDINAPSWLHIYRSTDQGSSWSEVYVTRTDTNAWPELDAGGDTIWGAYMKNGTEHTYWLRSTDGTTWADKFWAAQPLDANQVPPSIAGASSSTAMLFAGFKPPSSSFYHTQGNITQDGGETWNPVLDVEVGSFNDNQAPTVGWISEESWAMAVNDVNDVRAFTTGDNGVSWTNTTLDDTPGDDCRNAVEDCAVGLGTFEQEGGVIVGWPGTHYAADASFVGPVAPPTPGPEPVDLAEGLEDFAAGLGFKTVESQFFFGLLLVGIATVATGSAAKVMPPNRTKNYVIAGVAIAAGLFVVLLGFIDLWMFLLATILSVVVVRGETSLGEAAGAFAGDLKEVSQGDREEEKEEEEDLVTKIPIVGDKIEEAREFAGEATDGEEDE